MSPWDVVDFANSSEGVGGIFWPIVSEGLALHSTGVGCFLARSFGFHRLCNNEALQEIE